MRGCLELARLKRLAGFLALGLCGCIAPIALDRAVMTYDTVADDTISRELLVNIARAHNNEPLHFNALSNIAATFNFQLSAGITPPLKGTEGGFALAPLFGSIFADNPTFSMVPIEGEEFTKRLLTPFPESIATMLLRQGADVDLLLRLMAGEYRIEAEGENTTYYNKPADKIGYPMFRRVVLHLSTIQDRHALYAEPLIYQESWTVPIGSVKPETLQSLQKELSVTYDAKARAYQITKRTIGRIVITNYDPAALSNEERARLNDEAEQAQDDELMVDIRPGHVGGQYPLHGRFRMRSFYNVIAFVGRAMGEEPEYDVPRDSRTPAVTENPVSTLEMLESDSQPAEADRVVKYGGHYYALRPEVGYQWNKKAFLLLYQLFEMTVVRLPGGTAPSITISK